MSKCDSCLYSRTIISENGYHSICNLSDKKAIECVTKDYSYYCSASRLDINTTWFGERTEE